MNALKNGSATPQPPPPTPPGGGGGGGLKLCIDCPGPILESKVMHVFFRKEQKKGKIFENLGKNVQNFKIFCKKAASCVRPLHA